MEKMMNRFNVQGQVQQDSDGEFVRFSDVEEMRDSLGNFLANLFDETTEHGLTKEQTLDALNVFFRITMV
jgi:hypothetical protein